MLKEVNQAKRYIGARFGYGERLLNGIHAVPTQTYKGPAFMKLVLDADGTMGGFDLFWDEALTHDWHRTRPDNVKPESAWATAFRALEAARNATPVLSHG